MSGGQAIKILADENIVDVAEAFGHFGEVRVCAGRDITRDHLRDIDVLLVRSVTQVNEQLLSGSIVRFVGSATIGTDHIDLDYLRSRNIQFAYAPGCNADAVVQYVIAVLCSRVPQWRHKTVGIVGCGNVGSRLLRCLQGLKVRCRVYDPFLDDSRCDALTDFAEVMAADVICLHTPLTLTGAFPTHHMIDSRVLASMRPNSWLLNAGRGAVIDNQALFNTLNTGSSLQVVLDVWEHEPAIDVALLNNVRLGTPHIAGYSVEGKARGTQMILQALCAWRSEPAPVFRGFGQKQVIQLDEGDSLESTVLKAYDPAPDHQAMISALSGGKVDVGACFDVLRRHYSQPGNTQRQEFSHFEVNCPESSDNAPGENLIRDLETLGFGVVRRGLPPD